MKNIRQSNINIHKDAWVEINLDYLAHNIREIKKTIPADKKLMAIVDVVDNFFDKHNDEYIEKAKKALPIIKGYITDLERILDRIGKK